MTHLPQPPKPASGGPQYPSRRAALSGAFAMGGLALVRGARSEEIEVLRAGATTPLEPGASFEVVTWNVGKASTPEFHAALATLASGPRMLLLQEARRPMARAAARHAVFAHNWQNPLVGTNGVMTIGAAPLHADPVNVHTKDREVYLTTPKNALVTRHACADGRTLAVANVHSPNFHLGATALQRQLIAIERELATHDGPLIVGGDFNTWTRERTHALATFAGRNGLTAVLPERGRGATAERWASVGKPLGLDPGLVLDHLLVRDVTVLERIWRVDLQHSDHVPLHARLRL